jgi:hypothetical protein
MFLTADQLLAHVVGDYFLQSDWMATNKKDRFLPCFVHVVTYIVPFLLLTTSAGALALIAGTHFAIDHWNLARYPVWAKNKILGGAPSWKECSVTGMNPDRPLWLSVWLTIIVDNTAHIVINAAAIKWVSQISSDMSILLAVAIGVVLAIVAVLDL